VCCWCSISTKGYEENQQRLTKDVYGTDFYIYFICRADFIRVGLYLPLSFTCAIFDIRKLHATNELKKFLEKFDEDCKNQIERGLNDFPIGVTKFL
jgi:hypothetical protein